MTAFDYIVLAIVAASVILGVWRGVVGEIIALVAWVLAFFTARWWGNEVANSLLTAIADPVLRLVAAWVLVFVVVLILMALLRLAVRGLLGAWSEPDRSAARHDLRRRTRTGDRSDSCCRRRHDDGAEGKVVGRGVFLRASRNGGDGQRTLVAVGSR